MNLNDVMLFTLYTSPVTVALYIICVRIQHDVDVSDIIIMVVCSLIPAVSQGLLLIIIVDYVIKKLELSGWSSKVVFKRKERKFRV